MKRKALKGKDLMIFVDNKAIALATSHSLTLNAETSDTASKDSGLWDESEVTKLSWEASSESIGAADEGTPVDISYETLLDKCMAGEKVPVICGIPTNATNDGVPEDGWTAPTESPKQSYYKGEALITSVTLTGANGENSQISASFKGVGKLTKVPKTA